MTKLSSLALLLNEARLVASYNVHELAGLRAGDGSSRQGRLAAACAGPRFESPAPKLTQADDRDATDVLQAATVRGLEGLANLIQAYPLANTLPVQTGTPVLKLQDGPKEDHADQKGYRPYPRKSDRQCIHERPRPFRTPRALWLQ